MFYFEANIGFLGELAKGYFETKAPPQYFEQF